MGERCKTCNGTGKVPARKLVGAGTMNAQWIDHGHDVCLACAGTGYTLADAGKGKR